ncbi:MAG: aldehyde dehydrogenase family protein [Planctomycetota bacterium]|nr:MAG: aldehyde dehydrogenase family protein [Planctomycetota bacterium]
MEFLKELGLTTLNPGVYTGTWKEGTGGQLESRSPASGEVIGKVAQCSAEEYRAVSEQAHDAFLRWRALPAPKRGEYVRRIGEALRQQKEPLGKLISLEMGKIYQEGLGEVQEAIDIADFAVGLSRQLYGLTIQSERPLHSMRETWQPLGTVGVITAFNFPVAVWAWNAMLALVCGDSLIWKPSSSTPLCAIATTMIAGKVLEEDGFGACVSLAVGRGSQVGEAMLNDPTLPLISMTGSTNMGRHVAKTVSARFGRSILELGGNNAVIVLDDADIDLALRAILFGAVGTAGQRCTSTRRVLAQKGIRAELERRLLTAYETVCIGDPLDEATLMGPLIDEGSVATMQKAIAAAQEQGGELLCGGEPLELRGHLGGGHFVKPCIIRAKHDMPIVHEETFAPILYLIEVEDYDEAIRFHNEVPQGLSSAIFTSSARHAELFLSPQGSDCGIANVNLGTSGAEIGGAFGGEKETGGGRESGSDSWKAYMRRQTSTLNYGTELPLAQGLQFGD